MAGAGVLELNRMKSVTRSAPPKAGAMLEALRGLGYSTATALADIIDNSISAGASEIRVTFVWAGTDSYITLFDNGSGMTDAELERAMTLGDKSPLDDRAASDLGRFGMGLKTASFSQCRRLTVASRKEGTQSCLRWDLDELALDPAGGWLLFEDTATGSEGRLAGLSEFRTGTLVIWEVLDRIVTKSYDVEDFSDLIDRVEVHLAMVFHRLLQGPRARLRILLNNRAISPWDPFMTDHPSKTWVSPVQPFRTDAGVVSVECHVLPHKDRLSNLEFESGAGPDGWNAQQGFYVYRNHRLLVAGGWLGLGQGRAWNREEAYRLARIRLDIPNTADADWKIDIRKSTARPPVALRGWLSNIAEDTRNRARKVFAYRGSPGPVRGSTSIEQAWKIDQTKAGIRYRIDEKHPAVAAALEAAGEHAPIVRAMLRVVEETVPVQKIWLDTAENKDMPRTGFAGVPTADLKEVIETIFNDMIGRCGMSPASARQKLLTTEPFQNYPQLIADLNA